MYKYFKELEKPNDYTLQLVDTYDTNNINLHCVPFEFYVKYKTLFEIIKDLKFILKNLDFDDITKFISPDNIEAYYQLKEFYEEDRNFLLYGDDDIKASLGEIIFEFSNYKKFATLLCQINYLNKKIDWLKSIPLFDAALKDISNYEKSFKTINKAPKSVEEVLPNAWYITSYGDLYNTGCGHSQTNLRYEIKKINEMDLRNTDELTKEKEKYIKLKNEILARRYITTDEYNHYLNLKYGFASLDEGYLKKCHDPKIIKTIYGTVSAHAGFYRFFEKFSKYTLNPNLEREKLKELTVEDASDLFIKALGFSKMGCCGLEKTIVTSNINLIDDFSEYLKRGYDIEYHNPMIINKEKGTIEELDSLIIKRQLDKQINDYEKNKEPGYGKIF